MAADKHLNGWRLTLPESLYRDLFEHLFPGDRGEHGAIILAGMSKSDRGLRLIARELHLAVDGKDYVPGKFGYRMLRAEFIQSRILRARDESFAYLAIHNHGGTTSVGFSRDDFASHERGYPALLDIARGVPVGALVFAKSAVAGDLWFPGRHRSVLSHAAIVGGTRKLLYPSPPDQAGRDVRYDRQVRLFGDAGQDVLRNARVGIIGLGGAGSILAELLGRLGVGEFILADPDYVEPSNLPRLIGARVDDAGSTVGRWWGRWRKNLQTSKAALAVRNIRQANPSARVVALKRDFLEGDVAARFTDCDYLFLAADTMGARLLFNAIVHQYGVPGVQVGAKVQVDAKSGQVGEVFCVARTVTPGQGCLWCNGLISPARLQDEAVPKVVRDGYAYVADAEVVAPSVITLNAISCAHAADEFLFHLTGLRHNTADGGWFRWNSRLNQAGRDMPYADPTCPECSLTDNSRLCRGDQMPLPVRPSQ
jgi:molybdopterin/thiamine biosynthesis adenylyltransferase